MKEKVKNLLFKLEYQGYLYPDECAVMNKFIKHLLSNWLYKTYDEESNRLYCNVDLLSYLVFNFAELKLDIFLDSTDFELMIYHKSFPLVQCKLPHLSQGKNECLKFEEKIYSMSCECKEKSIDDLMGMIYYRCIVPCRKINEDGEIPLAEKESELIHKLMCILEENEEEDYMSDESDFGKWVHRFCVMLKESTRKSFEYLDPIDLYYIKGK